MTADDEHLEMFYSMCRETLSASLAAFIEHRDRIEHEADELVDEMLKMEQEGKNGMTKYARATCGSSSLVSNAIKSSHGDTYLGRFFELDVLLKAIWARDSIKNPFPCRYSTQVECCDDTKNP